MVSSASPFAPRFARKKERHFQIPPTASHCPYALLMHCCVNLRTSFNRSLTIGFYKLPSLADTRSTASRVFSMLLLNANFASGSSLCTALTTRSKKGTSASVFRNPTTTVDISPSVFVFLFPGSQTRRRLTSNHDNIPLLLAKLGCAEIE